MRPSRASIAVALVAATLGGCATPARLPATAGMQAVAVVPGYTEPIRLWADAPLEQWTLWRDRWLDERDINERSMPIKMLALSSGSDKGAFAAGYLNGWTQAGDRPEFALVTGVSTGALIAPFAFLGPDEDATLAALYTAVTARDIFSATPLKGVLGGPSLTSSKPLRTLIERYVTQALIERIAVAHRSGRRLLIMTTNLDAQRGVVWDIGAIAASTQPDRVILIRRILLASASIPGVFPPVLIDVRAKATQFNEMHVDGGTTSSVFVLPTALTDSQLGILQDPRQSLEITLLYNGDLDPEYTVVKPRTFTIISRALATVISEADRRAIERYRSLSQAGNVKICVESVGKDFERKRKGLFDQAYMQALFAHGRSVSLSARCLG